MRSRLNGTQRSERSAKGMDGRNTSRMGICWSRALYGDPKIVRGGEGKKERGDGGGGGSASEEGRAGAAKSKV